MTGWHDFMLRELLADYQRLVIAEASVSQIGPGITRTFVIGIRHSPQPRVVRRPAERPGDRLREPVRVFLMGAMNGVTLTRGRLKHCGSVTIFASSGTSRSSRRRTVKHPIAIARSRRAHAQSGRPAHQSAQRGGEGNPESEARPDVIVYTTPPLDRDLDVIGSGPLGNSSPDRLWRTPISSAVYAMCRPMVNRSTCVTGSSASNRKRHVEHPEHNGRAKRCCTDTLHLEIDLWATAHRFKRGHRVRLIVSSGAHPRWLRNDGTGEPFGTATENARRRSNHLSRSNLPPLSTHPAHSQRVKGVVSQVTCDALNPA